MAFFQSLSCVQLFVTPWTVACQAPLSMGFSRQVCWSVKPFLSPGIFPTQALNPGLLHCRQILYHLSHSGVKDDPKSSGLTTSRLELPSVENRTRKQVWAGEQGWGLTSSYLNLPVLKCLPDLQTKQGWGAWSAAEQFQQTEEGFLGVEMR